MEFTEEEYKEIAAQLRKPEGEFGHIVAEKMNEGNLLMNENTIEALEVSDHDRILEIGMGNGFFVKKILSLAKDVHYLGCDYSIDMVQLATKVNQRFVDEGTARFVHTTANNLPAEDSSINSLFTVNTLYFWDDHAAILAEFRRVLTEHGKLVLAFRPTEAMEMYPPTKYNFDHYSIEEASQLLEQHGFEIKEIREFEEPLTERERHSFNPIHVIIVAR